MDYVTAKGKLSKEKMTDKIKPVDKVKHDFGNQVSRNYLPLLDLSDSDVHDSGKQLFEWDLEQKNQVFLKKKSFSEKC